MKNDTNIYDIDGELIRKAGDTHNFTIEEAQNKIKYYQEKIKSLNEQEIKSEDTEKKIKTYEIYCKNLTAFVWSKLSTLDSEQLSNIFANNTDKEEINKALEEVKNDIAATGSTGDNVQGGNSDNNESNTNEESRNDQTIERNDGDIHEERPVTQSDLLVERDGVTTSMDEYVDFVEE